MKIVIDSAIPYIQGVWEPHAEVVYLPGDQISAKDVHDADALIVRTRTRCGESLLAGRSVRVVATATIGTDHIDLAWCAEAGIIFRPNKNRWIVSTSIQTITATYWEGTIGVGYVL